jgi:hypothetical protein
LSFHNDKKGTAKREKGMANNIEAKATYLLGGLAMVNLERTFEK